MAISFPGSKSNGQKFTAGNKSWTWNGASWKGTTSNGGDATSLGGVSATSFLRSDGDDGTTGSLGVGTTSPGAQLHVYTSTAATAVIKIGSASAEAGINFDEGTTNKFQFRYRPSVDRFDVYNTTLGSNVMSFKDSGNIGIGTTSPSSSLHLYDSTNTSSSTTGTTLLTLDNFVGSDLSQQKTFIDFRLFDSNTNETPQVRIGAEVGANTDANTQEMEGEGAFVVYTNDTSGTSGTATGLSERLRVSSNGNVGIGTTNPSYKLHVAGEGYFSDLRVNDDLVFEGNGTSRILGNGQLDIYGTGTNTNIEIGTTASATSYPNSKVLYVLNGNSDEIFTVQNNGNVGIGRTNPQSRLDVMTSARITSAANTSHGLKLEARSDFANDANSSLIWISSGATSSNSLFTGKGANIVIEGRKAADRHIYFKVGNTTTAQHVMKDNGNVGIGTVSPSEKLEVSGNILATGDITANSDISLKDNITPIPNALDKVLQIRGVTFNRNDIEDNSRHAGVIAQEVETVLPEVVSEGEGGIKSVAYGNMVSLLIEAIKEQQGQINMLKEKLESK